MSPLKSIKFGVRQKVLLLLMTVLLTTLTLSGWLAIQEEKENTLNEIKHRGIEISRFVAKSMAYSVVGYDYHTIDLLLNEIVSSKEIDYAKVVNQKGKIMSEVRESENSDTSTLMYFENDIVLKDSVIGKLTLGLNTAITFTKLESQWYTVIKREAFIILLIAIGEFIALSLIIIRPVSTITNSLNERVEEDGQIIGKIPITSNDEFGVLAAQFNLLSENLNSVNSKLKSRADVADKQLLETNKILQEQSKELSDINKELHEISITDSLTGLYNRRYFEDTMGKTMEVSKRHGDTNSLIMLDIDYFKRINDTYGHDKGDIVLKEVASILSQNFRKSDVLCRIGGEEFAAICSHSNKRDTLLVAEKIRTLIEQHEFSLDDDTVSITISIGVATITPENVSTHLNNLFRFADAALYESKAIGRNKTTHHDDVKS